MLTANAYLDHSGALSAPPNSFGTPSCPPSPRWWWHRFALLVASAAHDVGHPARMNPFMVATKHALTLPHLSEPGPLEAMHAAAFLEVTRRPGHNVFECLGRGSAEKRLVETVVELVLATDLSRQGAILGTWQDLRAPKTPTDPALDLDGTGGDPAKSSDDRKLFLKLVIKAADVSNPAKALPLYLYWTERVLEEFYDQGDEEKALGLAVTAMPACDRAKPAVAAGQKGFIAFIVRPCFAALADFSEAALDKHFASALAKANKVAAAEAKAALTACKAPKAGDEAPVVSAVPESVFAERAAALAAGGRKGLVVGGNPGWGGLRPCMENLEANLAFWKDVEDKVPAAALALACLPSDLPLDELAPDAMASELAVAEHEARAAAERGGDDDDDDVDDDDDDDGDDDDDDDYGGGNDGGGGGPRRPKVRRTPGGKSFLFEQSVDHDVSKEKKAPPAQPSITEGDAGAEAEAEEDSGGEEDLAAEVARLKQANEDLAAKLAAAEALIKALQDTAAAQSEAAAKAAAVATAAAAVEAEAVAAAAAEAAAAEAAAAEAAAAEEAEAAAAAAATTAGKALDRDSNPRGAYGNAHAVGARIRALQQTLSAMEKKDPEAEKRFLFQPRGHRLEPMANVESFVDQSKNNHKAAAASSLSSSAVPGAAASRPAVASAPIAPSASSASAGNLSTASGSHRHSITSRHALEGGKVPRSAQPGFFGDTVLSPATRTSMAGTPSKPPNPASDAASASASDAASSGGCGGGLAFSAGDGGVLGSTRAAAAAIEAAGGAHGSVMERQANRPRRHSATTAQLVGAGSAGGGGGGDDGSTGASEKAEGEKAEEKAVAELSTEQAEPSAPPSGAGASPPEAFTSEPCEEEPGEVPAFEGTAAAGEHPDGPDVEEI